MIYDHYKISEPDGASLALPDLLVVTRKNDNLRAFSVAFLLQHVAVAKRIPARKATSAAAATGQL